MSEVAKALAAQDRRKLLHLWKQSMLARDGSHRDEHRAGQGQGQEGRPPGSTNASNRTQGPTYIAPIRGPTEQRALKHMQRIHPTAMFLAARRSRCHGWRWCKPLPWGTVAKAPSPPPKPEDSPSRSPGRTDGSLVLGNDLRDLDASLLECTSPLSSVDSDTDIAAVIQTLARDFTLHNTMQYGDQQLEMPPEPLLHHERPTHQYYPEGGGNHHHHRNLQGPKSRQSAPRQTPSEGKTHGRDRPFVQQDLSPGLPAAPPKALIQDPQPQQPLQPQQGNHRLAQQLRTQPRIYRSSGQPQPQQPRWYPFGNLLESSDGAPTGVFGLAMGLTDRAEGIGAVTERTAVMAVTLRPDVGRNGAVGARIARSGSDAREARPARRQLPSHPRPPAAAQHPKMNARTVLNGQFPVATELTDAPAASPNPSDVLARWLPMHRAIRGAYLRLVERDRRQMYKGAVEAAWEKIWHVWDIGVRDGPRLYIPSLATPDVEASDAKKTQAMRHLALEASRGADARLQQLVRDMPILCMLLRKQSGGTSSEFNVAILLGLVEVLHPQLLESDTEWTKLASMARDEELPDAREGQGPNLIECPIKEVFHAAVLGLFLLDVSPETERDGRRVVIVKVPNVYECAALGVLHMESSWLASGKPAYDRWHWGISPTHLYYVLLFDTFVFGRPEELLRRRGDSGQERPLERFSDGYFAHLLRLLAEPRPCDSLLAQVACSLTFRDWLSNPSSAAIAMERLRAVLLDAERRRLRGQQQPAWNSCLPQQPSLESGSCREPTPSRDGVRYLAEPTALDGPMQSTQAIDPQAPQQTTQWRDEELAQPLAYPPPLERTMPQQHTAQQPLEGAGVCEDAAMQRVISTSPSSLSPPREPPPLQHCARDEGLNMQLQQTPSQQQLRIPASVQQPQQLHPALGQRVQQSDHRPPLQQLQQRPVLDLQAGPQPQPITQLSARLSEPAVSPGRLGCLPQTQSHTPLELQPDPKLHSQPHLPPCAQTPSKLELPPELHPDATPSLKPLSSAQPQHQVQVPPQQAESSRQGGQLTLQTELAPKPGRLLPQQELQRQHQLEAQLPLQPQSEVLRQSQSPLRWQQQPQLQLHPQTQQPDPPASPEMHPCPQLTLLSQPRPTQPESLSVLGTWPEGPEPRTQVGRPPHQGATQQLRPEPEPATQPLQQMPFPKPQPQIGPPPQLDPQPQQQTDEEQYRERKLAQPVLQLQQHTQEQPQPQSQLQHDVGTQPRSHPKQQPQQQQPQQQQPQQQPQGLTGSGVNTDREANDISFPRELYAELLQPRVVGPDNSPGRERLRSIMHVLRWAADHGLLDYEHGPDAQARALQVLRDIAARDVRPLGSPAWLGAQQALPAHWSWETDFVGSRGWPEPYTRFRGLLRSFVQGGLPDSRWGELAEELRPGLLRAHAGSWGRVLPQQSTMFGWLRGRGSAASSTAAAGPTAPAGGELPLELRRKLGFLALWGLVVLRGVDVPLVFLNFACCLAAGILRQELELKTAIEVENADISAGNLFRCLAFIPPLPYLPRKDAWARSVLPPAPHPLPECLPPHHPLRQQRMVEELEYGIRLYLADQELSSVLSENMMPPCMGLPQQTHRELLLALLLERWMHRLKAADGSPGSSEYDSDDDDGEAERRVDRWLLPGLLRYGCTSRP